jgi:hypothetical protein
MVWTVAVADEAPLPLAATWTALVEEARKGLSALEAEKHDWKPDPSDDWADVT